MGAKPSPVSRSFPPLGNSFVTGLATAELEGAGLGPDMVAEVAIALEGVDHGEAAPFEVRDAVVPPVTRLVGEINSQFFRFDVTDLGEPDEPLVLRPDHGDVDAGDLIVSDRHSTRKLTVLLPIASSGSAAVELGFDDLGKHRTISAAEAAVFPSYMVPILGFRDAGDGDVALLVLHALGPAFR